MAEVNRLMSAGDVSSLYPQPPAPNKLIGPMDAMQQNIGVAQGIQSLTAQQFDLASKQIGAVRDGFGSLAALDAPTMNDVMRVANQFSQMGVPSDRVAAGLAEFAGANGDPSKIKQIAYRNLAATMDVHTRLNAGYGQPGTIDNGREKVPVLQRVGEQAGIRPGGGAPMTNYMAPGLAGEAVAAPAGPNNEPRITSRGAQAEDLGVVPPGTYTRPAAPVPGAPARSVGTGGQPPSPPARSLVMGPAPGVAEAQAQEAKSATARADTLQTSAEQAPTRKAALDNMQGLLQQFRSGKGAEWVNGFKSAAGRYGLDFNPGSTAALEEFSKVAKQIAQAQAGMMHNTDAGAAMAMGANPNVDFSKLGNERVIAMLKGNEDAIQAKQAAWMDYRKANPAGSYDRFSSDFSRDFDPRVFQVLNMTPAQKDEFRKSLTVSQEEVFRRNYSAALQKGWIR
jgi:hypothetical protein